MQSRLFIITVVFFAIFPPTGWALENPVVKSPVGQGNVPPSSLQSGLVRSPNPIDMSSNLVVTGNVGGGKHFRGIVPYNAISDFGGRLGSGTLESFLRYSTGEEYHGRYTGGVTPYYSQTGTVTMMRPGSSAVLNPPSAQIDSRAPQMPALQKFGAVSAMPEEPTAAKVGYRPMSMTSKQMERVISSEISRMPPVRKETDEQFLRQMEKFGQDLRRVSEKASKIEEKLTDQQGVSTAPAKPQQTTEVLQQPVSPLKATEQMIGEKPVDVYELMRQKIGQLQKGPAQLPQVKLPQVELPQVGVPQVALPEETAGENQPGGGNKLEGQETFGKEKSVISELSADEIAIRAKTILGGHKTFASFSQDRFNQHMRAAEEYLKQGRYYRAADAYTLATIYKPDDPLAYAGKSHALFAAGEYLSSALFLSRALAIFPEYARFKIDIEAMVGSKDVLESRIVEVEEWLKRSDAGELHFLLGYIYYQLNRLDMAKKAIDAAYTKMPQEPAVVALKNAIYDAIR